MSSAAAIHASTFWPVSAASITGKGRFPASAHAVAVACGSASSRADLGASAPAIFTANVLLPTPPFRFASAMIAIPSALSGAGLWPAYLST